MTGNRGSTLLETLLAVSIMTVAGLSVVALLQKSLVASLKTRERITCERMTQTGMARLKNIDFYRLFSADSTAANYGLWAGYPHMTTLSGLRATLAASKYDHFRVAVAFMRRDSSDALGTGNVNNVIAFADANADLIDDYDPNIRYLDQNADGDYFDTYASGGRTVAEQPDTHLKLVTFTAYRRGRAVCSKSELISLEQFTGATNPDSSAALTIEVSTPANNAYAYQALSAGQIAARALAVSNPYPAEVIQYRADAASPLPFVGATEPLATVSLYVGGSGVLDTASSDSSGNFAVNSIPVTAALVEGQNVLRAQSVKSAFSSPWAERTLTLDARPPGISANAPTGTVATYAPDVAATLTDDAGGAAASGICPDVTAFKLNGSTAAFTYDAATGRVALKAGTTLSSGTYTALVEAGDYAGYKTTAAWSFTVSVPETDHSAPVISNKTPIGMAGSELPVLSVRVDDNQSGILPASITLRLDGAVIVDASNIALYYDPSDGTVTYVPSSPFVSGSFHTLEVVASHGATDPADKITSSDSWTFMVP